MLFHYIFLECLAEGLIDPKFGISTYRETVDARGYYDIKVTPGEFYFPRPMRSGSMPMAGLQLFPEFLNVFDKTKFIHAFERLMFTEICFTFYDTTLNLSEMVRIPLWYFPEAFALVHIPTTVDVSVAYELAGNIVRVYITFNRETTYYASTTDKYALVIDCRSEFLHVGRTVVTAGERPQQPQRVYYTLKEEMPNLLGNDRAYLLIKPVSQLDLTPEGLSKELDGTKMSVIPEISRWIFPSPDNNDLDVILKFGGFFSLNEYQIYLYIYSLLILLFYFLQGTSVSSAVVVKQASSFYNNVLDPLVGFVCLWLGSQRNILVSSGTSVLTNVSLVTMFGALSRNFLYILLDTTILNSSNVIRKNLSVGVLNIGRFTF